MEKKEYIYVKFPTNIAQTITFNFDTGIKKEGQYGEFYNWGVKWEGKDAYMSATPMLNEMLLKIGSLYGKTVQVLKYEDGNKKMWKILDLEGNILAGDTQSSKPVENAPQAKIEANNAILPELENLLIAMEAMRTWAKGVNAEIKFLREKVSGLETLSVDLNGKEAVDFHQSFPVGYDPKNPEYRDITVIK